MQKKNLIDKACHYSQENTKYDRVSSTKRFEHKIKKMHRTLNNYSCDVTHFIAEVEACLTKTFSLYCISNENVFNLLHF